MGESEPAVVGMRAVAVSREYGSGGGEVAARLARRLGWRLIDHEFVAQVALRMQVPEAEARDHDEHVDRDPWRIFGGVRGVYPPWSAMPHVSPDDSAGVYQAAVRHVVEGVVDDGMAVIVGRGAQMILADRADVLRVRVVAPIEQRVGYVARRERLAPPEARARIEGVERDREEYIRSCYRRRSDDAHLYDLIVNTAVLDLDAAAALIALALERKATRVGLPPEQLGPGAGMPPYPGPPGGLIPPMPDAAADR